MSNASMRQALVKVHRYVGLALAPFIIIIIIIIAATGSIITFFGQNGPQPVISSLDQASER
jgi:uncharacterized iron-regulated membrane protein